MKCLYILLLSFIFSVFAGAEPPNSIRFPEDPRVWEFQGITPLGEAAYLPQDQKKEDWTEAMMFRFLPAEEMPLPMYYEYYIEMLNDKSMGKFESRVLDATENSIVFEWWTTDDESPQHGWIQLRKVPGGIQFFRLTTKNPEEIEELRPVWEKVLKTYTFEFVPQKVHFNLKWDEDKVKWEQKDSDGMIYYFYPEGENKDHWNQRLSIYIWNYLNILPNEYFELIQKTLKEKYGENIQVKRIYTDEYTLFFEWSNGERKELYKLNHIAPNITTLMRYSVKDPAHDMKTWENILEESNVQVEYESRIIPREEK